MAEVTCSKQPTSKQTGKVFWKGRYVDPQELFQVGLYQKTQGQSLAFVQDKLCYGKKRKRFTINLLNDFSVFSIIVFLRAICV